MTRILRLIGGLTLVALVSQPATARSSAAHPEAQSPSAPKPLLEDVVERRGPIQVAGRTFTIVLHSTRLAGAKTGDDQALERLEILDAGGVVRYSEPFEYSFEYGQFIESCAADVEPLNGSNGRGFLIEASCLPSGPLSGGPWRILRLLDDGRIVPIGKQFATEGELGGFVPGSITHIGALTQILPDTVDVRVWTGYFFAKASVRIDWLHGSIAQAERCYYQTGHGFYEEGCEVSPDCVERHPPEEDQTFVRMFPESRDDVGTPAHVVVKRDSKVEILSSKVLINWHEGPDEVYLGAGDDVWFKVRIDGREGWIHTQEDLGAIGLWASG